MDHIYGILSSVDHQCDLNLINQFINDICNDNTDKYRISPRDDIFGIHSVDLPNPPDITKDIRILIEGLGLHNMNLTNIIKYLIKDKRISYPYVFYVESSGTTNINTSMEETIILQKNILYHIAVLIVDLILNKMFLSIIEFLSDDFIINGKIYFGDNKYLIKRNGINPSKVPYYIIYENGFKLNIYYLVDFIRYCHKIILSSIRKKSARK